MSSTSNIRPTGVMEGIDPFSWRSISSQRARLDHQRAKAEETQPENRPEPRAHRWPRLPAFSDAISALIGRYKAADPGAPPPVPAYAGRFEAVVLWREDVETFAAHLALVHPDGGRHARWFGVHPAQYPTVESLAQALDAHGVGLDHASLAVAQHYQRDVWDVFGACAIVGVNAVSDQRQLGAVTPRGQVLPLAPALQRDQRSEAFGPAVAPCRWGQGDAAGALETARIVLDYADSTLRTSAQLFNDARALAITVVQRWPPDFAVSVADVHLWTHAQARVVALADGPAIGYLQRRMEAAGMSEPGRSTSRELAVPPTARPPVRRPPLSITLED